MYVSFQLTPPRASSQVREGLIPLLLLVSFYVAGDCVCLYNRQSHIFDYFYILLEDDCFQSIENRACASLQFPIDDLYLPLEGVTLPYPVIVLTDSTFCVFLAFFIILI